MYSLKKPHIHFVGIGGIGMSGIATILHFQGYTISGCDSDTDQKSVHALKQLGCAVHLGNNSSGCADQTIDVLVYSSAIQATNPEIVAAQQRGIPTITRATMLAELMRSKYSIAISGAHGKTTTTSMISHILIEAQRDPTVIIGGHVHNISHNARIGSGNFIVAEADESDKSFLRLFPTLAVVTNIDFEHPDMYRDLADVQNTFIAFLRNIPFYGKAFLYYDDINIRTILPELSSTKTITFGCDQGADIQARDLIVGATYSTCTIWKAGEQQPLGSLYLTMPGKHNILNALAATAVALELDIPLHTIAASLASFKGVDRRFSYKGLYRGAEIFDDYGHHPREIFYAVATARKRARNKLIVAFQPHRYTRTSSLWNDFLEVFRTSEIDHLVITDIYPASEAPIEGISSKRFVEELQALHPRCTVTYAPYEAGWSQARNSLEEHLVPQDLLLLLGAGKINQLADILQQS